MFKGEEGLDIKRQVVSYALIKTLHDAGQSYVDIFIPLLLITLDCRHTESYSDVEIKRLLNEDHGLDIPVHMVRNTLRRTNSLGYSRLSSGKKYSITTSGMELLQSIQSLSSIKRTINCFADALYTFAGEMITTESLPAKNELMDMFFSFIYTNSHALLLFTKGNISNDFALQTSYDGLFKEFLINIELSRPELYNIFEDILIGSILCSLAGKEDLKEVNHYYKKTVFLDSNIVFSILGFHHDEYCVPCRELHQQLINFKFNLLVFDFTLKEMIGVLNSYRYEYPKYIEEVKVDSIYSNFKLKGLTPTDIDEIITNIEELLSDQGIQIYPTIKHDREELLNSLASKIDGLQLYKPYQKSRNSLCHDLLVIDYVKRMRTRPNRKFDKTDYFFLTSDTNLTRYALESEGHNENFTISEVILDSFMTSLLWIKNPTNGFDTKFLLPSLTQKNMIDRYVWEKFVDTAINMLNEGKVLNSDLSMLIYNKEVRENLREMNSREATGITDETLEDILAKAHINLTALEDEVDEYKNKLIENEKDLSNKDKELRKEKERFINSLKQKIEILTNRSTMRAITSFKISLALLALTIGLTISYITYHYGINYWLVWFAPSLGLLGFLGLPTSINYKKLIEKFRIRMYNYYLKKYREIVVPGEYINQINTGYSIPESMGTVELGK